MARFLSVFGTIAVIGSLLAACGGGGTKTVNIPGGGQISSSNKLPSSFPGDFPIYDGAKVLGSVSGTSNGINGTSVTWETGDGVDKVKDFYDSQFGKNSWKSSANGTINQGAFWSGENKDSTKAFYAFASAQDGKTNIVVTVGDNQDANSANSTNSGKTATAEADSGSSGDSSAEATDSAGSQETPTRSPLPVESKLDKNFPSDRVPLPSDARVTSTSSAGSGTSRTFSIVFLTKDDAETVSQYFSDEMPKHGWSDAFSSNSDGAYFVTFTGSDGASSANDALTLAANASTDNPGYSEVALTVSVTAAGG